MDRNSDPTAPAGLFTEGTPGVTPATVVTAQWLNDIQEEIMAVIEDSDGGNLTPDDGSQTQLKEAISAMIAAQGEQGSIVGVQESSLGSTSTVTATSATDSGLQVDYTAATATNDRYLEGIIDWEVSDTAGNKAEAFVELQYSSDGSSWSVLKTFTKNLALNAGNKEVQVSESVLGSDVSTSSTSNQATGMQINWTSVAAANPRYIEMQAGHYMTDSDVHAWGYVELQYSSDGSSWSTLRDYPNRQQSGGATSQFQNITHYDSYRHTVSNATPYYRVVHRAHSSGGGTSTVFAGAMLRVREFAADSITTKRENLCFVIKHNANDATPQYRIAHKVTSGDTSKIYSGSVLRVREYNGI